MVAAQAAKEAAQIRSGRFRKTPIRPNLILALKKRLLHLGFAREAFANSRNCCRHWIAFLVRLRPAATTHALRRQLHCQAVRVAKAFPPRIVRPQMNG
jgi:hypothetical protein